MRFPFWPSVIGLLAVMAVVQILSVRGDSPTWDEPTELAAGYSYWKTGDYRLNPEHPPLQKLIAAAPLLFVNPTLPLASDTWTVGQEVEFGRDFLFHNRVPAETILFSARMACIALALSLGLAIAMWTRRAFGVNAALLALAFYAFDPNVIAHGRLVKNDIACALTVFLACAAWGAYLRRPALWRLAAAGAALGCAITTKFSAVFLLAVFPILYVVHAWQNKRLPLRQTIAALTGVSLSCTVVVLLCYAPVARLAMPTTSRERAANPGIRRFADAVQGNTRTYAAVTWLSNRLGLQTHPFLKGIVDFAGATSSGRPSYLLGMRSPMGWWYYFPVAFALKTPVATLLALALALWLFLRTLPWGRLRQISFDWYVLAVPLAFYVAGCLDSKLNIGLRHLLPAYPFIFILAAALLTRWQWKWSRAVLAAIVVALMVESLSIYPHYLAFFNVLSGGPKNGPNLLVDSNVDWGQDARRLKEWMVAHQVPRVCVCFFGAEDFSRIGIDFDYLPRTSEIEQRKSVDCWAAISATPLQGIHVQPEDFAWLRALEPAERVGYSIYLYDLRKRH